MKIRCLLIGAPGSGKGTQAAFLAEKLKVPVITTSQVIRDSLQEDNAFAANLKQTIAQGKLIDDALMWEMLQRRVSLEDCRDGFILDGFPRTERQLAFMLAADVSIEVMLYIDVPDEVIMQRLAGRRVHPSSQRVYHIEFNPPKQYGVDDVTGEPLVQRDDDKPDVIVSRLMTFRAETMPVIDWASHGHACLQKMLVVDGSRPLADIRDEILSHWSD